MRGIFSLPPLLVAGAAHWAACWPHAVGSVPTGSSGIGTASDRPFGTDVPICRAPAAHRTPQAP